MGSAFAKGYFSAIWYALWPIADGYPLLYAVYRRSEGTQTAGIKGSIRRQRINNLCTVYTHEFHKWHILAFDCRIECKISDNSIRVISNEGVAIYCDVPMYGDDLLDSAGNRVRCRESTTCYATPILELNEKKNCSFQKRCRTTTTTTTNHKTQQAKRAKRRRSRVQQIYGLRDCIYIYTQFCYIFFAL